MSDLREKLGQELYDMVVEKVGDSKIDIITNNYISRERFNEVNEQVKLSKTELTNKEKLIEELTNSKNELTKKATDLETRIKSSFVESTLKNKAILEKAKDPSDILRFIDIQKLELDENNNIKDLDGLFNNLKENKSYLFGEDKVVGASPNLNGKSPTPLNKDEVEVENFKKALGIK